VAYADDINALNPVARYPFNGGSTDTVNGLNGTNVGGLYTGVPLCEDMGVSYLTDDITDRVTLPTSTLINGATQSRKAVGGWFSATGIQNPPKSIYGEGDTTQAIRFILGWGNNLVFEIDTPLFTLQIFGDVPLETNRPYHLFMVFEGNAFGNEFRAYLDGVKQLNAAPIDRQPNATSIPARTVGEFGDPVGNVAVGGTQVILLAPINGQYNQWAIFDGADAVLTDAQIREELFEKGALPDVTITNQAGLDAFANLVRPNVPCCIRVTGNGTINLSADNITFDSLASIHVQYTGTGTVNWTNINGSDASIGSVTEGGTINFINPATLTIEGLINGGEVHIYDDEIANGRSLDTELAGSDPLSGTTFAYPHSGASNTVIVQSIADGYEELTQAFTLDATDQLLTLIQTVEVNE
jgi:hypothetical protein